MAAQEATDVRRILAHVENNAMPVPVGNLIRLATEAESRNASAL
jgi:hypothetical protein